MEKEIVSIVIDKSDHQFLEKNEDRTCEVVNLTTNTQYEGFIVSLSTSGTYLVELRKEIEGVRK